MKSVRHLVFSLLIPLILFFLTLSGCSGLSQGNTPYQIPTDTSTPLPTATIVWFPSTATPTLFVAPTIQPTENQLEEVGSLILSDNFEDTTAWQVSDKLSGSVEYSAKRLTLAVHQPQGIVFSFRPSPTLKNAYVEITTSISLCSGNDSYGLLFRASSIQDFYRLSVNCNGLIRLERVRNGVVNTLTDWTISSQLSAGAPLSIKLGAWMDGTTFRVFINNAFQFEAHDDAFSIGTLGVFARSAGNTSVTVNFSNLQVFELSTAATTPVATPLITP
jgi:hypothetical protein